jgi:hypothetical protein
MKIVKRPAATKLVARFDNELRSIIMNDLKAIKTGAKILFMKHVQPIKLSVA